MRPSRLAEVVGQRHLLEAGMPLQRLLECGQLHSAILWGPPGTGKTSLARLLAGSGGARFVALSAVTAGVREIREVIAEAAETPSRPTVLFLDEVHRFNKAQQDAFLPAVESGALVFIGATTENPSFSLNNALLSRARVYLLQPLDPAELVELLRRALSDPVRGLGEEPPQLPQATLEALATAADGDARRALNLLETAARMAGPGGRLDPVELEQVIAGTPRRFDRGGDLFHDQVSALHKAVRGSDPDAALYWLARLVDAGCDPHYVARRIVRMASEDIGNADPRALDLALSAWQVFERLGSPEGELALAQAVVFLACAAKSNAIYLAWGEARKDVREGGSHEVPLRLRNAPTALARSLGHGASYRYAHDEPGGFAGGEHYFPDELSPRVYYRPVARGLEIRIAERLAELRELNRKVRMREPR
ncbi:MAG: replication-associated recombination protein A [Chromatiales bacterium]|nr:replication-associated recombination protein A [Chromatiales bacterium]